MNRSEIIAITAALRNRKKITIHWTAGDYIATSTAYHVCIKYNIHSKKAEASKTRDFDSLGAHTWLMNSNNIGVSLCAMEGATGSNYGKYPVLPCMIEKCAKIIAEILIHNPDIDFCDIHDHAWYSDNAIPLSYENSCKWDVKPFYKQIMAKIPWYLEELRSGRKKFELY